MTLSHSEKNQTSYHDCLVGNNNKKEILYSFTEILIILTKKIFKPIPNRTTIF